jgi:hypothetical protein
MLLLLAPPKVSGAPSVGSRISCGDRLRELVTILSVCRNDAMTMPFLAHS